VKNNKLSIIVNLAQKSQGKPAKLIFPDPISSPNRKPKNKNKTIKNWGISQRKILKDQQGFSSATLIVYYDQRAESIKTKRKRSAYFRTCHRPVLVLVPIRVPILDPMATCFTGLDVLLCVRWSVTVAGRENRMHGGARQ